MPANRFTALPSSSLTVPFTQPNYDAVSSGTPLSTWKFDRVMTDSGDLLFGSVSGSTGETCALLIVIGGAYLASRRMMSWVTPIAILATVAFGAKVFAGDVYQEGISSITPDDIAAAVLYLASQSGSYLTGNTIHVNGGMYTV